MRLSLIIALIVIQSGAFAQDQDSTNILAVPKHLISVSPLHMLNRFPTIFIHYETNLKNNWNVSFGAGVVLDLEDESTSYRQDFLYRRGFKLNNEYKYYFYEDRNTLFSFIGFFEYFNIQFDRARTFGFDCTNDFSCSYFQYNEYEVTREHLRFGMKGAVLVKFDKRFAMEFGMGLVLDVRNYSTSGRLENFDVQFGDTSLLEDGSETLILPIPHLKFGYLLR